MAKEASFDIVSEFDLQEVDNALNQARREASTRFDLKSAGCEIDFKKDEHALTLLAANDMALKNVVDIVSSKLISRGIDIKALELDKPEPAAGGAVRQTGKLSHGIPTDVGRDINKLLKQTKMKVTVQIQGDQVRVTGKSRDDLQEAMKLVKEKDFNIPIQFQNFR